MERMSEVHVSSNELLKAVGELSASEFERFSTEILTLRARRTATSLPRNEARLLSKINQGMPPKVRTRLDILVPKRISGTLGEKELAELKRLTDQAEKVELDRIKNLMTLAHIRKAKLSDVMKEVGIRTPEYA